MNRYEQRAKAILARISELAAITDEPGIISRVYGTAAFLEAGRLLVHWMQEAGLETRMDAIGNVRGRLVSTKPHAKTLFLGSHFDTVINAGAFDGPLGILLALDLIHHKKDQGAGLPFHLELVCFCDEEGVRFHTTYLGSRTLAGSFEQELLERKDPQGITLREAIEKISGNPASIPEEALLPEQLLGYFEMHIEQGPVLYEADIPVAVVTGIAGQRRMELRFTGEAGHAGTVPMAARRDALGCAAECIGEVERFALADGTGLVATVGKLDIPHAASNVIPGEVTCTLDIRHTDNAHLQLAWEQLDAAFTVICTRRRIEYRSLLIQQSPAINCDTGLMQHLQHAIEAAGLPVLALGSGAGHDVVPLSAVCPVSMMFIRCYRGISHHPAEQVEAKDIAAALEVAGLFLDQVISSHNQH